VRVFRYTRGFLLLRRPAGAVITSGVVPRQGGNPALG